MKFFTFLFFSLLIKVVIGTSNAAQMSEKWQKINALVEEEIRTIETAGLNNAGLKYRLFELYSERIKLLREKENKVFLEENPALRKKHGKDFYFSKTAAEYKKTHKYGIDLIKYYPKYKSVADIYYTLALNSRDYAKDNKTEKYLKLSLKSARKGASIIYHAKTSLAEYYYNTKQYWRALSFYKDVLKNTKDEWHSKNLVNSAWCFFKVKNFKRALINMRSAYSFSVQKQYINVTDQVLDSISLFYVNGEKVQEGIDFYSKFTKEPASYLMKMAQHTTDEGSLKDTRKILKAALVHAKRHKNLKDELIIYNAELSISRQYHRHDLFYKAANNIESLNRKMPIKDGQKEEIVQKISEFVGFLQIKLSKNKKTKNTKYDPELLKKVVRYFEILSKIDVENNRKYSFFTGESYYSVSSYTNAANSYKKALEESKKSKTQDPTLNKKILNSLLGVIATNKLSKKKLNLYKLYTYQNYLAFWPVDDKSQALYKKLFNLNLELRKPEDAVKTVDLYNKNYPSDSEVHRNMINKVVDYHIKNKNTAKIASWIKKLETGYLAFDQDYIKKATLVLGQLLFERYQSLDKKGKKSEAADGYIALYENDLYPKKVHAESAYNASILYLELGNLEKSFKWFQSSLPIFKDEEIFKLKDKTLNLSKHYALMQDFEKASFVAKEMTTRFCHKEYKEKESFFSMSVSYKIIEEDYENAFKSFLQKNECNISEKTTKSLGDALIVQIYQTRDYATMFLMMEKIRQESQVFDSTIARVAIDTYWDTLTHKDKTYFTKANQTLSKIHESKHEYQISATVHDEIDEIQLYKIYKKDVASFIKTPLKISSPFDAQEFNMLLEDQMMQLKDLNDRADQFIKKAYPEITLSIYSRLVELYTKFGAKVRKLNPSDQPAQFISSFKKQMHGVSQKFFVKARDYKQTALRLIASNEIYTSFNKNFHKVRPIKSVSPTRYPASNLVVPMDTNKGKRL